MDVQTWAAFAVASFIMGVIPGPGVASIVGFAFSSGQRVALASVAGMAVGNAAAISVSLARAGAILASSSLAFTVLKWAGALYLIVIGVVAIVRSRAVADLDASSRAISARTAFLTNVALGTFLRRSCSLWPSRRDSSGRKAPIWRRLRSWSRPSPASLP